jgi:hypothetical protein
VVGVAVLPASVVLTPLLVRKERRVARALRTRALGADVMQTTRWAYPSLVAIVNVTVSAVFG